MLKAHHLTRCTFPYRRCCKLMAMSSDARVLVILHRLELPSVLQPTPKPPNEALYLAKAVTYTDDGVANIPFQNVSYSSR